MPIMKESLAGKDPVPGLDRKHRAHALEITGRDRDARRVELACHALFGGPADGNVETAFEPYTHRPILDAREWAGITYIHVLRCIFKHL
jgi:hypothetical protein